MLRHDSMYRSLKASFASLVLLMCAVSASAYTIVFVDGRRVEIPAQFEVSKHTLTYQVSPDIQVTLHLKTIDIAATERANGETPGSFYNHAMPLSTPTEPALRLQATRSLTNKELEPYARVRRESAQLYEQRRKELGLPSLEETRRRQQAEAEVLRQELQETRNAESEQEGYWRTRASELRSEMAAVDAEITYVRTRLDEVPILPTSSYTVVSNAFPIGIGGGVGFGLGRNVPRAGFRPIQNFRGSRVFTTPQGVLPATARVGFSGTTLRGRIGFNRGFGVGFNQFGGRRPFAVAPPQLPFGNLTAFSSPFAGYDYGYAREVLVVRLDELVGRRAALRARWRDLEEEARRAGAMPGWLRP